MLADPLVLTHDSVDTTFSVRKINSNEVIRQNVATSLTEPEELTIRHSSDIKKGGTVIFDRHNMIITRDEKDSSTGLINRCSVSLTVTVPRTGQFSESEVTRLIGLMNDLVVGDSRLGGLLRGES